jgi:hypothetical protein
MAEAGEDLAPIEQTIREYVGRELRKVDGIRSYLKHAEMMVHGAKNEAKVQNDRANAWQGRIDRLKEFCRGTMEAWVVKRLDGSKGSLLLKGNGGRRSVTITDASLIPEEFVQYEGQISGQAWEWLRIAIPNWIGLQDVHMERVPHKGRIGEALAAACPLCSGSGKHCDGDGLARVPGARLEPRGNHVEVR